VFPDLHVLISSSAQSLWESTQIIAISAVFFVLLALLVKGKEAIDQANQARRETSVNLRLWALDTVLFAPIIAFVVQIIRWTIVGSSFELIHRDAWNALPQFITAIAALFLGDFISYCRHRIEHTRLLWPSHAIHHSDTEMTWLTLSRFHPINRLTTMVIDTTFLAVLGFPEWSLVLNVIVRHFYGEFIHADFPWTYGPLGRVFVSPVMHRWHHAREVAGSGSNFATVFSVFDQAFGTYYVPGLCCVPLGVNDKMGKGLAGQLSYPFAVWARRIASRARSSASAKANSLDHDSRVPARR
jgi:sterol desaturase/sphingolipid hydroxylase (fatty acid hydroxylase superfamily)